MKIKPWTEGIEEQWNDWHWQLRESITSPEELYKELQLPAKLEVDIKRVTDVFQMSITPYYLMLLKEIISEKGFAGARPLLKTVLPSIEEISIREEYTIIDGIGEELSAPPSNVSRFYPDRALIFVTSMCAGYCRYCFRRRKVEKRDSVLNKKAITEAIEYIRESLPRGDNAGNDPLIRDVILSGGDPLILSDGNLEWIFRELRDIPHVKIIRIDTKAPVFLPQRITDNLVKLLKKYRVYYMIINFTHPDEVTEEVKIACEKLVDSGILLGSHTTLLRGVNDSPEVIKELMLKLVEIRVRPYYLIQFIPTKWTEHFRTSISRGKEIMEHLWGHISGIANPTYIVYLPHGAGKIPIYPNYVIGRTNKGYIFRNFENREVMYEHPLI